MELAQAPNVAVKLSGLGLGHPGWTIEDTAPLLRRVVEIFGTDRAMFGTNLPVERLFSSAERILRAYAAVLNECTPTEKEALLRTNAERAYRI